LADYEKPLKELFTAGYVQDSVANKLNEWFSAGLKDWDISRDGPYFGFKIPGEENKFFYVCWMHLLDIWPRRRITAIKKVWISTSSGRSGIPQTQMMVMNYIISSAKTLCISRPFLAGDVNRFRNQNRGQIVRSWLSDCQWRKNEQVAGDIYRASTYLKHLDPEYLRYYYASKLTDSVDDIDLSVEDFVNKTNSDMVGKFANLASRSVPMLTTKLDSRLGQLDDVGRALINKLVAAKDGIIEDYEKLKFAAVTRTLTALADEANRYVEQNQPWATIATDPEKTRTTLTTVINAVHILTIYLKPILPKFAEKIEKCLNIGSLSIADLQTVLENHRINNFVRLVERIDETKVNTMIEESKDTQAAQPVPTVLAEPIKPECTIDDFAKIDLRVAKVTKAEKVEVLTGFCDLFWMSAD